MCAPALFDASADLPCTKPTHPYPIPIPRYYSQEALFQDPMLAKRKAQKDWQFVAKYFQEKSITEEQLSDREEVYETQVGLVWVRWGRACCALT